MGLELGLGLGLEEATMHLACECGAWPLHQYAL